MSSPFSEALTKLRKERNLSQRTAAADLNISQALLSHYENGIREPRLDFVVKAADYFGVSTDYMLGRTESRGNPLLGTGAAQADDFTEKHIVSLTGALVFLLNTLAETHSPECMEEAAFVIGSTMSRVMRIYENRIYGIEPGKSGEIMYDAAERMALLRLSEDLASLKERFPALRRSMDISRTGPAYAALSPGEAAEILKKYSDSPSAHNTEVNYEPAE